MAMEATDGGGDLSKITFRLPRDLHQRFKSVQAFDGRSLEEVLVGMVGRWVEKKEQELKEGTP